MVTMNTRRAVLPALRRRRPTADAGGAPVYWGRIGAYEAVTRDGILLLLSPDSRHASQRSTGSPTAG